MSKKAADDAAAKRKKPPAAPAKAPAKKAAPAKKSAPAKKAAAPAKKAPAKAGKKPAKPEQLELDTGSVAESDAATRERPGLEAAPAGETRDSVEDEDGDDAGSGPDAAAEPAVELTDEEKELQGVYGDDLKTPAIAHGEYRDRQTTDEDRPMMPEINARDERNKRWEDRRDGRRRRRDRPGGGGGGGAQQPQAQVQGGERPSGGGGGRDFDRDRNRNDGQRNNNNGGQQNRPQQGGGARADRPDLRTVPSGQPVQALQAPVALNGHEHDALGRVGTPLGDAAATVFAQLRNGQPLPLRQLAGMMRKRNLVEQEPEQLAPQLKAELLGDERSYKALGLRPRIVYRGRDLFAPGPVAMSVTAEAEAGVAAALSRLAGATHRALAQRIAKATPGGFERLVHAFLVAAGYSDVEWVKRTGGIAYASATAPGIDRQVLISARSGDEPIDRRGVGELRVGVEAKNLVAGVLFSARGLSEEAETELQRPGRSIHVMCGDHLVAALVAAGVGVVSAAAPMHYVDDQLLDELLAG